MAAPVAAERALAGALDREFNRALLESMSDGVVACDADGVLTLFNRAAREWHGAGPMRLPSEDWARRYDLYRADGVTPMPADEVPLARAFRGETVVDAGMVIAVRGRPVRHLLANGGVIRDQAGRKLGAVVVMRDVTELRRVEAELRRANEALEARVAERTRELADVARRLNEAQRIAHLGSWELDLETSALRWSDEIYRIFEIDPVRFGATYQAFLETIHPDDRAAVDAAYTTSLRTRTPYTIDHRLRFPDGRVKHVHEQCESFFDGDRPIRSVGTVQDVTARKEAEQRLREHETFVRNILDSVDDGIVVVDREYRVVAANRACCAAAGRPEAEIVGRRCWEAVPGLARPCDDPGADCPVRRTFETGAAHAASQVRVDHRGARRDVELRSFPITDASGAVTAAIETTRDVTDRRRLEEQLRQAQKMEAIGTLAGGVAHDFNNILTGIVGYGYSIQETLPPGDPLHQAVEQILAASDRAAQLTRGLLAFGRRQIINPRPTDLNAVVREVETLLRRLIPEDIDLSTRLGADPLVVLADAGQLQQVLMNLATNARDAMPDGGILAIATEAIQLDEADARRRGCGGPGPHALLSVSDTGAGMDAATREKAFEPFFTTKPPGKGTGLGLAIVYGIVTQHGGAVDVYSEPGRGTTFKILLPLVAAAPQPEPLGTPAPAACGGSETILLAEDDPVVRGMIAGVLTRNGYRVVEAVDGEDALEKFTPRRDGVDLLILDVVMPRKSGREVYDAVRAQRPDVRVLFLSGYTADIIHKKGIFDEGLEFASKPLAPVDLLRRVRGILDAHR